MKITNKYDLPEILVAAMENDPYTRGDADISVTQLIDSPRVRELRKEHPDRESDVSDMVWAFFGQSVHAMLERIPETEGVIREQRISIELDKKILSGQFDLIYGSTMADYKVTSVWSVIYGKPEWDFQLNTLRYIWEKQGGHAIDKLQVIAFLRDWQKSKAGDNYPVAPICAIDIDLWDMEKTERYIAARMNRHFSDELYCSDRETWKKDDTWAMKKKGRKTAVKVFHDEQEANDALEKFGTSDNWIEHRKGRFTRCEDYCDVQQWCDQFSKNLEPR